jgi:hypothetical protein
MKTANEIFQYELDPFAPGTDEAIDEPGIEADKLIVQDGPGETEHFLH